VLQIKRSGVIRHSSAEFLGRHLFKKNYETTLFFSTRACQIQFSQTPPVSNRNGHYCFIWAAYAGPVFPVAVSFTLKSRSVQEG